MNSIILLVIIILGGVIIYFIRPQKFFLYWLGIQPYIIPVSYMLFKTSFTPFIDKLYPTYCNFPEFFSYLILLMIIPSCIKYKQNVRNLLTILIPIVLLIAFLVIQNNFVGLHLGALSFSIKKVLWSVAPVVLLILNEKVRPNRNSLINFVICFVFVQVFFCFLNLLGLRIYEVANANFDDLLICGTFSRYNHMANFLVVFFIIISYEYLEYNGLKQTKFFFLTFLIGLLIIMSGSRMALLLFVFTGLFFVCVYQSKKKKVLTFLALGLFVIFYLIGNKNYSGEEANDGTGFERNLIGIIDLANSDDLSEGSTLAMSAYILLVHSNSPLIGNGRAYRGDYFYGHPDDTYNNENIFLVDARLAFMFVEYGIIGLSLFLYLYASLFKGCYLYSEEHNKYLYWMAGIFFTLFSLTDPGFWDLLMFSIIPIYVFSVREVSNERSCSPQEEIVSNN